MNIKALAVSGSVLSSGTLEPWATECQRQWGRGRLEKTVTLSDTGASWFTGAQGQINSWVSE